MEIEEVVYSTEDSANVVPLCERGYAPEIGSVFSSYLCPPRREGGDFRVMRIKNYTGYVRRGDYFDNKDLRLKHFYRFIVTAVHSKGFHNYFYAVPFRELKEGESDELNLLNSEGFLKLKRFAERVFGLDFDRDYNKRKN